jgi:hypothetical protein
MGRRKAGKQWASNARLATRMAISLKTLSLAPRGRPTTRPTTTHWEWIFSFSFFFSRWLPHLPRPGPCTIASIAEPSGRLFSLRPLHD